MALAEKVIFLENITLHRPFFTKKVDFYAIMSLIFFYRFMISRACRDSGNTVHN